jgi:thymidylate synthase
MNNLDKQYTALLQDILDNGVTKQDRTGTGTISVFGRQIRHKMSEGFPLLTTKKVHFKSVVTELLWFLRGDTNIKFLVDNNCHIWDGDAYKNYCKKVIRDKDIVHYLKSYSRDTNGVPTIEPYSKEEFIERIKNDDEFAKKWGDLGPVYGKQWRGWGVPRMESKGFDFDAAWEKSQKIWKSSNGMECGPSFETFCMSLLRSKEMGVAYGYHTQTDQIQNLINDIKTNPDSRRLMVNAWNVSDLPHQVLPPCHYGFQVYTRELSLEERREIFIKQINGLHFQIFSLEGEEGIHREYDKQNVPRRAISLMWNQRSVDTGLGLSFNIASYSLLLMMIAKQVNMVPYEVIGNLGDVHLYLNHIEPIKEQLTRESYPLPTVKISDRVVNDISEYTLDDIILENYQSHPTIKMPLSN